MLEQELLAEIRKTRVQQAILGTLAVGAMVSTGGLAAMMIGAYGKALRLPRPDNLQSATSRLAKKGFVRFENREGKKFLTLTAKGSRYIRLVHTTSMRPRKPKRWDKKWRVVIFDIPEKRKRLRELLRATLLQIGFMRLQDSVWVYPYDCEELITLLKADFKTGRGVLYMIVDKIENDKPLRAYFAL